MRLEQVPICVGGRGVSRFHVYAYFHVAAVNFFAHDLPQPQIIQIESLGHAQLEVQEPVIHALHADAHRPAILFGSRLCVSGHRETFDFLSRYWARLAHKEFDASLNFPGAARPRPTMSSSPNSTSHTH